MSNSRKICPLCRQHFIDETSKTILLTNNRLCHEKCAMDRWKMITTINERADKHIATEFPKKHLFSGLNEELQQSDAAILLKKNNTGLFTSIFSSTYARELDELKAVREKIVIKIDQLKKEHRAFDELTVKQSVIIRREANVLYDIVKTVFDFWPTYPPDWKRRVSRKNNTKTSKCEKCGIHGRLFHVHHKIPISQGGNHKNTNLALLCERCHKDQHGVQSFTEGRNTKTRVKTISNTDIINKAIQANKTIRLKYRKFDGEVGFRTIDPQEIIMVKNSKCVRGFCHLRNEDRSFKISRISSLKII